MIMFEGGVTAGFTAKLEKIHSPNIVLKFKPEVAAIALEASFLVRIPSARGSSTVENHTLMTVHSQTGTAVGSFFVSGIAANEVTS